MCDSHVSRVNLADSFGLVYLRRVLASLVIAVSLFVQLSFWIRVEFTLVALNELLDERGSSVTTASRLLCSAANYY